MYLSLDIHHPCGMWEMKIKIQWRGRVLGLVGHSGSGKSTLLQLIAGLQKPQRGIIAVDKKVFCDTSNHIHWSIQQRRAGMMFQDGRLFPHLNVRENLLYARGARKCCYFGHNAKETFRKLVEILDIESLLNRMPEKLSGGEMQRVALGRTILAKPDLLLLDEPLSWLDDGLKKRVMALLQQIRDEENIPMIYVSHDMEEVGNIADQVMVLKEGSLSMLGPRTDAEAHRRFCGHQQGNLEANA